jgi:hypothetical protein
MKNSDQPRPAKLLQLPPGYDKPDEYAEFADAPAGGNGTIWHNPCSLTNRLHNLAYGLLL